MIRISHDPILQMVKLRLGLIIHLLEGMRWQEVGSESNPGPSQAGRLGTFIFHTVLPLSQWCDLHWSL